MAHIMIWPDLYREHGHWLPHINLAASLTAAGDQVSFMGIPDCAAIVEPYGYGERFHTIFADIYPPGHSTYHRLEPIGQRWKPHHLLPLAAGTLDAIFTGEGAPDLLVSGYFNALETLLIHYRYNLPFVTTTTYLRHPQEIPALFAKSKLLNMPRALQDRLKRLAAGDREIRDLNAFVQPLREAAELIPCLRAFDFTDADWVHQPQVHYVEPMIQRPPHAGVALPPPELPELPTDKKILFGTAGSQGQDYLAQARQLFINLIDMMKTPDMGDYHLVLAVGDRLESTFDRRTIPSNVTLLNWISQLDILQRAEVVFAHGGLATIKESIFEQVPVILVPLGKDQTDNALRIRRSKIGLSVPVDEASPQRLRKLLREATTNNWTQRHLARLASQFALAENNAQKPSLTLIHQALEG